MRVLPLAMMLVAFALLAAGCDRTAELIPGAATDEPTATPTQPPIVVPTPIVPPSILDVAGAAADDAPLPAIPDLELARSVVQISTIDTENGIVRTVHHGSGVVVDQERALILTSYPLVDPFLADGSPAYSTIAVGRSAVPGEPATILYEAEIVTAAPEHDLAVLRAVRTYRGDPLTGGEFSAPAVRLGNSATIAAQEELRLFGFAGAGEDEATAVTVASAKLLGARSAFDVEGRAWLDVDARLPAGMDGGPAFAVAGALIGVLVQLRHDEAVPLGTARPVSLAAPLIRAARSAAPRARYHAPLQRSLLITGAADATGRPVVIRGPAFAENAIDAGGRPAFFDYTPFPATGLPALYYEFAAQGIPATALVEERWYLEGVLQDPLSSSYMWTGGEFAVVADRLLAPNPNGIPLGRWRLEVWVDGSLAAAGRAYIGTDPTEATVGPLTFASTAGPDQQPLSPPSDNARQLLGFFEYEGAAAVGHIHWVVFHDGDVVYESPRVRWTGGESGLWWVGHHDDAPLEPGTWEFELYVDNIWTVTGVVELP